MKEVQVRGDWQDGYQRRLRVTDHGDYAIVEIETYRHEFTEACIASAQYRTSIAELVGLVEMLRDRKVSA